MDLVFLRRGPIRDGMALQVLEDVPFCFSSGHCSCFALSATTAPLWLLRGFGARNVFHSSAEHVALSQIYTARSVAGHVAASWRWIGPWDIVGVSLL